MSDTYFLVTRGEKTGPFFSRGELDSELGRLGLSAGRGYAVIRESGRRAWGMYDFACRDCGAGFEALLAADEAHEAKCPACGSANLESLLAAPHVGAPHILADGSKRSEQDELRFRRLKVERQSWGLPWQKRAEHKREMAELSRAANKAEGRGDA